MGTDGADPSPLRVKVLGSIRLGESPAAAQLLADGCTRCPEELYFNLETGRCERCTKCLGSLVERLPCANEILDYCSVLGQFDRLCCEEYEYEAYGECILDCQFVRARAGVRKDLPSVIAPKTDTVYYASILYSPATM